MGMSLKLITTGFLIALVCVTPVFAQDETAPALKTLRACLDMDKRSVESDRSCIGIVAETCRAAQEHADTTIAMVDCALEETLAWDILLNEEYRRTRAFAEEADKTEAALSPHFANMADSLLTAQRAWIAFRDADCGLAYARWGSGSMRNIAAANCRMVMTAERTAQLRAMRGEAE